MARNDQRLPDYQDPMGGNRDDDMTLPNQRRPIDTKIPGVKRVGSSFSATSPTSTSIQRNQGGAGGGNLNTGDASGVGGQKSTLGVPYQSSTNRTGVTPVDPSTYSPQQSFGQKAANIDSDIMGTIREVGGQVTEKGLLPVIGGSVKTLGSTLGEGAARWNERVSGILPSPEQTGRFLMGPSTQTPPTSTPTPAGTTPVPEVTPVSETTKATVAPSPTLDTSTTLGKISGTTPTGGSYDVSRLSRSEGTKGEMMSQSGQPISKIGDQLVYQKTGAPVREQDMPKSSGLTSGGMKIGHVSTPESQAALQATINREADPAFKARMAEQADIVNQRIAQRRAGEAEDRASSDKASLIDTRRRLAGGDTKAQIEGIDQQLSGIQNVEKAKLAASYDTRRQESSDIASQREGLAKAQGVTNTARAAGLNNAINDINAAKATGMPDSMPTFGQSISTTRASGAPLDRTSLDTMLSHYGLTNEFNSIPNESKTDWLLEQGVQQQHIDEILGN